MFRQLKETRVIVTPEGEVLLVIGDKKVSIESLETLEQMELTKLIEIAGRVRAIGREATIGYDPEKRLLGKIACNASRLAVAIQSIIVKKAGDSSDYSKHVICNSAVRDESRSHWMEGSLINVKRTNQAA
ncbi:MAG: hypothetical protein M1150_03900 [Patescibacteria group bacterium]|nr:hypothetical protein [Patescibacteria group bacterium]